MRSSLCDLSRWQGVTDMQAIKDAGFVGAVARCTIGMIYLDPQYKANQQKARDADLVFGAYHVLWPANKNGSLEMEWFDHNAGDIDLGVLDVELTHGLTKAQVQSQALDWHEEYPQWRDTRHVTYTGSWWWNRVAGWEGEADDGLWEAEYTINQPRGGIDKSQQPEISDPKFIGWKDWLFWQWTSGGKPIGVQSESLDYDVFNGNEKELRVWLGLDEPPLSDKQKLDMLWEHHPELHSLS